MAEDGKVKPNTDEVGWSKGGGKGKMRGEGVSYINNKKFQCKAALPAQQRPPSTFVFASASWTTDSKQARARNLQNLTTQKARSNYLAHGRWLSAFTSRAKRKEIFQIWAQGHYANAFLPISKTLTLLVLAQGEWQGAITPSVDYVHLGFSP